MGSVFYSNKIILIPSYHTLYPCLLLISLMCKHLYIYMIYTYLNILLLLFSSTNYLLDQIRIRNVKGFITSLMLFLSLCRSKFLAYILFLVSENLLLTFLTRQQIPSVFVWENLYFSFTFSKFAGYRLLGWWVLFFFFLTLFFIVFSFGWFLRRTPM